MDEFWLWDRTALIQAPEELSGGPESICASCRLGFACRNEFCGGAARSSEVAARGNGRIIGHSDLCYRTEILGLIMGVISHLGSRAGGGSPTYTARPPSPTADERLSPRRQLLGPELISTIRRRPRLALASSRAPARLSARQDWATARKLTAILKWTVSY